MSDREKSNSLSKKDVETSTPNFSRNDYLQLSWWQQFFDEEATISMNFHDLEDQTQILVVTSHPKVLDKSTKPIVVIPGWFSMPDGWVGLLKTISQYATVTYVETREKISSLLVKDKKTAMGVDQLAKDLSSIHDKLSIDFTQSICVGSSLGGSLLIKYLVEYEVHPFTTVLIGPNPEYKLPPLVGRVLLVLPLFMIKLAKRYAQWHMIRFRIDVKNEPEQAEKYKRTIELAEDWKLQKSFREVTKFKGWDLLPKIQADVILVSATTDKLHGAERTLKVGRSIPNARYIEFESNKSLHSEDMGKILLDLAQNKTVDKVQLVSEVIPTDDLG